MGSSFIHLISTDSNEFFLMGGEGGGRGDRDGEDMWTQGLFISMYDKIHYKKKKKKDRGNTVWGKRDSTLSLALESLPLASMVHESRNCCTPKMYTVPDI